jgi:hypothetical protein
LDSTHKIKPRTEPKKINVSPSKTIAASTASHDHEARPSKKLLRFLLSIDGSPLASPSSHLKTIAVSVGNFFEKKQMIVTGVIYWPHFIVRRFYASRAASARLFSLIEIHCNKGWAQDTEKSTFCYSDNSFNRIYE